MDEFVFDDRLPIIRSEHFDLGVTHPMEEGPLMGAAVCIDFLPQDENRVKFIVDPDALVKLIDFVNRHKEEIFK